MKEYEFLADIDELIEAAQDPKTKPEAIKYYLDTARERIKWRQEAGPESNPTCGLYLGDASRFYGFDFQQLQYFVAERLKKDSVHKGHGLDSLFRWLWEVNHTSLGDIWTDLVKDVQVTFHRPKDLTDEQQKEYDKFWDDVEKVLGVEWK